MEIQRFNSKFWLFSLPSHFEGSEVRYWIASTARCTAPYRHMHPCHSIHPRTFRWPVCSGSSHPESSTRRWAQAHSFHPEVSPRGEPARWLQLVVWSSSPSYIMSTTLWPWRIFHASLVMSNGQFRAEENHTSDIHIARATVLLVACA